MKETDAVSKLTQHELPKFEEELDHWYDSLMGTPNYHLYNGLEYLDVYSLKEGHPFFENEKWQNGSVVINGILYPNELIRYDLTIDALIVRNEFRGKSIQLHTVDAFQIGNNEFVFNNTIFNAPTGFYKIIYDKNLKLFVRTEKEAYKKYLDSKAITAFNTTTKYYLQVNHKSKLIKNKSSIIALFPQFKKEIDAYVKSFGLKVKPTNPNDILKVVVFVDQLIQRNTESENNQE